MSIKLPKRYIPQIVEPKWQKFWEKEKIYRFDPKSKKKVYSVDTPPPYVSAAHLHVGHAMSYTQAEFIVRFYRMSGFNVFYPMGFDDNGLPTERYVEQKYKVDKTKITRQEFVKLCLTETKTIGKIYKDLWYSLGISVDWSLLYSTINPLSQRVSQRSFIDLYKKNKLVQREEPVIWCPRCQTALAQADLEDLEEKSYLNYINFELESGKKIPIATTRPELIPACVAAYANPKDFRYKKYFGQKIKIPLFNYTVPFKTDPSVDPEYGTGLLMVCTWGDVEDIKKWKKDKLKTRLILNKKCQLNNLAGPYQGLTINQARKKILEDIKKRGLLSHQKKIGHVVNIHDRCKTKIEFYKTKQWFIKILDIKNQMLKQGEKLNWYPKFMKKKYDEWVRGLKWDWNISRERYYGVPFPVWYCKTCGKVILAKDSDLPVDPREQPPKIKKCPKCKNKEFIGEKDVMDTWMTSSLTPLINARFGEKVNLVKQIYPMSLRPQAFEIIRTWLFYTLVKSYYHTRTLPWKDVMISGHGVDSQGRKMSKSLGNVVAAEKVIEKYGADSLRFWACGANLGHNLRYQDEEVKEGKRLLTKLWNVSKFCLTHLPQVIRRVLRADLRPIDLWILTKLQKTIQDCTKHFAHYEYSKARNVLFEFFWKNLADNYLELVKYRLYQSDQKILKSKYAAQFTLYQCLLNILKLWAPFLPHITEEIWQIYFRKNEKTKSIHISPWPRPNRGLVNLENERLGDLLVKILSAVRKRKSKANLSMAAEIKEITIESKEKKLIQFLDDLKAVTRAKKVNFGKGEIKITKDTQIKIIL